MSWASSRISRGLVTQDQTIPAGPTALSVAGKVQPFGLVLGTALSHISIKNFDETIGTITAIPSPDGTGIKVDVSVNFPSDYRRYFAILRGRYEYKRNTTDSNAVIVYEDNSWSPSDHSFVDTSVEPGVHYYYSLVALFSSASEPSHLEYNPSTGFASAYRYGTWGHGSFMFSKLPIEWQRKDDGTALNYLEIFGRLFDSLKTDIEAYILNSKSIYDVEESQLPHLGALIGWEINRELTELEQRNELAAAPTAYKTKGRNRTIEYLGQLASGWNLVFESGEKRLFKSNDPRSKSVSHSDPYAVSHLRSPIGTVTSESLGTSDGTASQSFTLAKMRGQNVVVKVTTAGTEAVWEEVDNFTSSTSSDNHYTVTVDSSSYLTTVTFGDGTNGSIPANGSSIVVDYEYGGDKLKVSVGSTSTWRSPVGSRVILEEAASSKILTEVIYDKIEKIIRNFKASYTVYNIVISPIATEESAPSITESFSDSIISVTFLKSNTSGHKSNTEDYVSVIAPY